MLPVMLTGVVWLVPKAVWEPEPVPPPSPVDPADGDAATASHDATPPDGACAPGADQRLVFKGYIYETRVNWHYADTPLSTPWQASDVDEAQRRNRKPAVPAPAPPVVAPVAEATSGPQRIGSTAAGAGDDPS